MALRLPPFLLAALLPLWAVPAASGGILGFGSAENAETVQVELLMAEASQLARHRAYEDALGKYRLARRISRDDPRVLADLAVTLAWSEKDLEAIEVYEALPHGYDRPDYLVRALAKSYRNSGRPEQAAANYRMLLRRNPADQDARLGLAWVLSDADAVRETEETVAAIPREAPQHIDGLFALAMVYWRNARPLDAVAVYDRVLAMDPLHRGAINLRARVLSSMGACGLALDYARAHADRIDGEVLLELELNAAAARIRCDEPEAAVRTLDHVIETEPAPLARPRAHFDRIVALRRMRRMQEIVASYEALAAASLEIPYWVHQAAADAYLDLRRPEKAAPIYREIIAAQPDLFNPRMALYYATVELGRYREAGAILDELAAMTPDWITERGVLRYNHNKEQVLSAQAWWLAYQDRLAEAEAQFEALLARAPGNLSLRAALGEVRHWRGRPHEALEDLAIVVTMSGHDDRDRPPYEDEYDLAARNSLASALNACYRRREARAEASALLRRNPANKHTIELNDDFRIEDRTRLLLDAVATSESPGAEGLYFLGRLEQPILPDFRIYALWIDRWTRDNDSEIRRSRAGLGTEADLLAWLTLSEEITFETNAEEDPGLTVAADLRPADGWRVHVRHETVSSGLPLQAAAQGIQGNRTGAEVEFVHNEIFRAHGYGYLQDFDDGNELVSAGLSGEAALHNGAHLDSLARIEVARDDNDRSDVPYFSPQHGTTVMATHELRHVLYQRYERRLVHLLGTGLGGYWQAGYDPRPIWDLKYEQDYRFSKMTGLLWGANYGRRSYDGEDTDIWSVYMTLNQHM